MPDDLPTNDGSGLNEGGNSASDPDATKSLSADTNESAGQLPQSEKAEESDIDPMAERRKKAPPVDLTKLDVDAVRDMASTKKAEQDAKLREELEARPVRPSKSFQQIAYRNASPCASVCKTGEAAERISFCNQCKLRVYDFTGMEQPEAEELIFKMEGSRNVPIFRRRDGKFLIQDCPVGLQNRKTRAIVATVSGLFFIAAISLSCLMPKPVAPPAPAPTVKRQEVNSEALSKVSIAQKSSRGWMARAATQGVSKANSKPPMSPMSSQYAAWGGLDPSTAFKPPAPDEVGFVQQSTPTEGQSSDPMPIESPPASGTLSAPPTVHGQALNQTPTGAPSVEQNQSGQSN